MLSINEIGQQSKEASVILAKTSTKERNVALHMIADKLITHTDEILESNAWDVYEAKKNQMNPTLIDRLQLDIKRVESMAKGLYKITSLDDPVGETISKWKVPNGLQIEQRRVPLGVIGIIYESRPNVTCDGVGLCLKSGNSVILKGGKEAFQTNTTLVELIREALMESALPVDCVQYVPNKDRQATLEMMKCKQFIDVLIPRGGSGLIQSTIENATIPVIETGTGNCHIYIDEECDNNMAINIAVSAKISRPSVCNSIEKIIVHDKKAKEIIPPLVERLKSHGVEIKGDKITKSIISDVFLATEEDWETEYLDYIVSFKIVKNIEEAIHHINTYGSHHSDAIVTSNDQHAQQFLQQVDSAVVYVNASTRFTDGEEFGFGGEIGISTQKLHARGPMGLKELTSLKYVVIGEGQTK